MYMLVWQTILQTFVVLVAFHWAVSCSGKVFSSLFEPWLFTVTVSTRIISGAAAGIDDWVGWQVTFLQDAEDRLSLVYGVPVAISPAFLQHTAISNQAFLIRLLFNLKRIYFERKDPVRYLYLACHMWYTSLETDYMNSAWSDPLLP